MPKYRHYNQWKFEEEKKLFLELLDNADERIGEIGYYTDNKEAKCPFCNHTFHTQYSQIKSKYYNFEWNDALLKHMINAHNFKPQRDFLMFIKIFAENEFFENFSNIIIKEEKAQEFQEPKTIKPFNEFLENQEKFTQMSAIKCGESENVHSSEEIRHICQKLQEVGEKISVSETPNEFIMKQYSYAHEAIKDFLKAVEDKEKEDKKDSIPYLLYRKNCGPVEYQIMPGHWDGQSDFLVGLQLAQEQLLLQKESQIREYSMCSECNYDIPMCSFETDKWKWTGHLYHLVLFHNAKPNEYFIEYIINNYWKKDQELKDYILLDIRKVGSNQNTKMKCTINNITTVNMISFANVMEKAEFRSASSYQHEETCPFCGLKINAVIYNDGLWTWTSSLRGHYLLSHNVTPDHEFMDYLSEKYGQM